jgi:hypothetical protein
VDRESEMRRREAVSFAILKCEVHWEMSCVLLVLRVCVWRGLAYGGGVFVEKHFDGFLCIASVA